MKRRETQLTKTISALLAAAVWTAGLPTAAAQNSISAADPAAIAGGAGGGSAAMSAAGDSLRLLVGRSMFINTDSRLRRVYVSNPDVLNSFTSSPNQIVVTAKSAGVSGVILWDEKGESHSYFINSDVDVTQLRSALRDALPGENIRAEGHEDQVALAGTVSSQQAADAAMKLASLFSKSVTDSLVIAQQHTPQVKLKVRVVEIDRSRAEELGFNFFGGGKNTFNSTTGQYPAITVASNPQSASAGGNANVSSLLGLGALLNMFYYNQSLGLGAAIEALENKQILQILAEPTLTAVSGEKASFLSGGEFPFPVVQGASSGFTSVTIQFRPYGVKLDFSPVVLPDGTIQMKVAPEVSALDYTNSVQLDGYTIPAISTRKADTDVILRSGQSFAITGLLDNRTTDLLQKMPGIGDVPILGKLFQTRSQTHSVVELVVIVTPTLVDPLAETVPAVPAEPKMSMPFINDQKFDKGIAPKNAPQGASQQ